jgi:hypothetical protein
MLKVKLKFNLIQINKQNIFLYLYISSMLLSVNMGRFIFDSYLEHGCGHGGCADGGQAPVEVLHFRTAREAWTIITQRSVTVRIGPMSRVGIRGNVRPLESR